MAAKLPVCGSQAAISASKGEAPVSVLTGLSSHFRLSSSQLPNIELSSSSTSPSLFLPTARLLLYPHFFLHSNSEICSFLGLHPLQQQPPPVSPSLLSLVSASFGFSLSDSVLSLSAPSPSVCPSLCMLVLCAAVSQPPLNPPPSHSLSLSLCVLCFVVCLSISPSSLCVSQTTQPQISQGSIVSSLLLPSDLIVQLTSHLAWDQRRADGRNRGMDLLSLGELVGCRRNSWAGESSDAALPVTKTSGRPGSFACHVYFT